MLTACRAKQRPSLQPDLSSSPRTSQPHMTPTKSSNQIPGSHHKRSPLVKQRRTPASNPFGCRLPARGVCGIGCSRILLTGAKRITTPCRSSMKTGRRATIPHPLPSWKDMSVWLGRWATKYLRVEGKRSAAGPPGLTDAMYSPRRNFAQACGCRLLRQEEVSQSRRYLGESYQMQGSRGRYFYVADPANSRSYFTAFLLLLHLTAVAPLGHAKQRCLNGVFER